MPANTIEKASNNQTNPTAQASEQTSQQIIPKGHTYRTISITNASGVIGNVGSKAPASRHDYQEIVISESKRLVIGHADSMENVFGKEDASDD